VCISLLRKFPSSRPAKNCGRWWTTKVYSLADIA
jgi:hypothetical protein